MSQFGAEKFTTRSREVVEAAQLAATTGGNTTTEPIHLLVAERLCFMGLPPRRSKGGRFELAMARIAGRRSLA